MKNSIMFLQKQFYFKKFCNFRRLINPFLLYCRICIVGSGVEWWVWTQRPSERAASANIPSLLRCVFTTSVFSRDLKCWIRMAAAGVSYGSLVVVPVRRVEEFDARPQSLRYNWFRPFAATVSATEDLSRETPTATPKRPSHNWWVVFTWVPKND